MRISDWSSDVCSSDLLAQLREAPDRTFEIIEQRCNFLERRVDLDAAFDLDIDIHAGFRIPLATQHRITSRREALAAQRPISALGSMPRTPVGKVASEIPPLESQRPFQQPDAPRRGVRQHTRN